MDNGDTNDYTNEELTKKLFEGIDKYGLLEFMYMIYDASLKLEGARMGANFCAIRYTKETLFEVK